MKKNSAFFILWSCFLNFNFAHAGTLTDHLEKIAASGQTMTLDQALNTLPLSFDRFALPYASNSPMGSSLENPRVILGAERGAAWVAFAGHEGMANGNQIEVIETTALNPDWGRLTFSVDGKMQYEKRPQSCLNCHSVNLEARFIAPIWDTYPDWIGIYGSAHSGILFSSSSRGSGGLPLPEFEKMAYNQFLSNVPQNPRYRWLAEKFKLPNELEVLAEQNMNIGLDMAKRQFRNIFYLILSQAGVLPERSALNPGEIAKTSEGYYQKKRTRFLNMISQFGTKKDQEHYQQGLPISTDDLKPFELRAFDLFSAHIIEIERLEKLLAKFGLPPALATLTKERSSMSHANGIIMNTSDLILDEAWAYAESNPDHSALNAILPNLCERFLWPQNLRIRPLDQVR